MFYTVFLGTREDESSIMCDHPDSCTILSDIVREELECNTIESLVEVREWLVEDEYIWCWYNHPHKCYTFTFTTRESQNWSIEDIIYPEYLYTCTEEIFRESISSEKWWENDVFSCSTRLKKYRISKKDSDTLSIKTLKFPISRTYTHIVYTSVRSGIDTTDNTKKSGLSRSRWSSEYRYITLIDIKRYIQ